MAYTEEQAVHHVVGKGYSEKAARKIIAALGPQKVFEGGGPAGSSSGEASAFVQSFGYSPEAADKIVRHVEPHIILAHKALDDSDAKVDCFWDPKLK